MAVSRIAIGQWKQLCRDYGKCNDDELITKKVIRAFTLGQITHIYENGNIIKRYHDLNLLESDGEIQTIWRDSTSPSVFVDERLKLKYDLLMEAGDW